jgi:hypothetical protein
MRCPTDVHRGKHREDVRLQERNQDLEGRQENEQAEWQNADWN